MRKTLLLIGKNIKNIRWTRVVLFFGVLVGTSCFADNANSDGINLIIQLLDVVFAMISAVLTPAVILAGWLLSPDWTMGDFFGLRKYFLNVWVLVSNLVYIAFALILLFMAVMQIFGGESSEYTFKQKLPKFLVGILMVPFTWLIVSWTLSFANQATAAVLSVPMGAIAQMQDSTNGKDKGLFHDKVIPTKITLDLTQGGSNKATEVDCKHLDTSGRTSCISAAEFVANNGSGPYFIMMIYAYDIFKIQRSALVDLTDTCKAQFSATDAKNGCIKKLTDVLIKFGTALITTFFFGVLTIALCWVLLMRAFKLWLYIMFSPLFGIAYFTGEGFSGPLHSSGGGDSHGGSSGLTEVSFAGFFKLAMVPVMVSAVLSFGLLFIGVISQTFTTTNMTEGGTSGTSGEMCTASEGFLVRYCITPHKSTSTGSQQYSSKLVIGSDPINKKSEYVPITFEFGDMFSGFVGDAATNNLVGGVAKDTVDSVESIFAHIILTLLALAIIWTGVKAAVNYDEVTRVAFEPFAKLGDSVQHFVAHIPSYIPTPHPAFTALTPGFASNLASKMRSSVDKTVEASTARSMADILGSEGIGRLNAASSKLNGTAENLNSVVDKFGQLRRGERDSEKAFKPLAAALNDATAAFGLSGAELQAFNQLNAKLQTARSRPEAAQILADNQALVKQIKTPGVINIFEQINSSEATSTSTGTSGATLTESEKFRGQTISDNGSIQITGSLSDSRRKAVRDAFGTPAKISEMKIDEIKSKLESLGFAKEQRDKIDSPDEAKRAATDLLNAANR